MAAERAAELSDKTVCVVPDALAAGGLAAAVALDPTADAQANAAAMPRRSRHVRTGAVTEAARDDAAAPAASTAATPSASSTRSSWPGASPAETLRGRARRSWREDAELVTLIAGDGAPLDEAAVTALAPDGVELEYSCGGQPSYWWLIAAE